MSTGVWPRVGDPAPAPPPLRSEADVVARWVDGPPVVSVLCATYQHVGFIADAIAGFLGQDTDFPFEVIVRDDASTDGTAEIVADLAARYPSVVRAVLEPVNRGRQASAAMAMARGEFHARCEGDDHWTDPAKLATQVATLRARPDVVASFHDAVIVRDGHVVGASQLGPEGRRDRTAAELRRSKTLPLRTLCVRALPGLSIAGTRYEGKVWNGDRFLTVRLGAFGDAAYDGTIAPAVYRKHEGGVSTTTRADPVARAASKAISAYWTGAWLAEHGYPDDAALHLARAARIVVRSHADQGIDPTAELARQLRPGASHGGLLGRVRARLDAIVRSRSGDGAPRT